MGKMHDKGIVKRERRLQSKLRRASLFRAELSARSFSTLLLPYVRTLLSLALFTVAAFGQHSTPAIDKDSWLTFRQSIVSFGVVSPDAYGSRFFQAIGTGVIVRASEHQAYIFTAKHMFCDPEMNWHPPSLRIRLSWEEHKSIYSFLGVTLPLIDSSGRNMWVALTDGSDVAAIAIPADFNSLLPEDDRKDQYQAISTQNFADADEFFDGAQVLVFGYPGLVGNDRLIKAITRQGVVAWTDPKSPSEHVFLVDANLYPGNSGGPVFKIPFGFTKSGGLDFLSGGKVTLMGIVSQAPKQDIVTKIENPRLGAVEAHTPVVGIGALGFIESISKVSKLLEFMQNSEVKAGTCDLIAKKLPRKGPSAAARSEKRR